jgi:Phosphotransferase enzyme family
VRRPRYPLEPARREGNEHLPQSPLDYPSIDALLADCTDRSPIDAPDGKSGNPLERVVISGRAHVVKYQTAGGDWISRVTGEEQFWPYLALRSGIFAGVPDCIDHAIEGMAVDESVDGPRLAILMRDVTPYLVPEGDTVVTPRQHQGFLEHMAALHAAFWGWDAPEGLLAVARRVHVFAPASIAAELARRDVPLPLRLADQGWKALPNVVPRLAAVIEPLLGDPTPLVDALATTPATLIHGDWKMGNLGWRPEGRTVLLDWAAPGAGPPLWDLVWYLALNAARLPESKEASTSRYRQALEGLGIETDPWFDRQLDLCVIAIMVDFAWEKVQGDPDELDWWEGRVVEATRSLGGQSP